MSSIPPGIAPPGPFIQWINKILHQKPVEDILHTFFWTIFFLVATPVSLLFLHVQWIYKVTLYLLGLDGYNYFAVKNREICGAVVITGCDSGFGRELAIKCAQAGWVVFAGCLSAADAQFPDNYPIVTLQMDVTKDEDVNDAVDKVKKWLNGEEIPRLESVCQGQKRVLHALVNNAGVGVGGEIDWTEMKDFEKCMNVNYLAIVRCCKRFLPLFKNQDNYKYGRIFNVASMAGMVSGAVGLAAYHASKHATVAFSTCLRIELASFGIQVMTVNPSFHGTPLVNSMWKVAEKGWNNLPEDTKQEYGREFFEKWRYLAVGIPLQTTWNADICVNRIMRELMAKECAPELLVGADARYVLPILRMLPAWIFDMSVKVNKRPIPASRHKKKLV